MIFPNVGRTEKLSARVSREIEKAILRDRLGATTRLPTESELCRSFGVSRTVVREALQQLAARGIIHSVAGSGSYVSPSNLDNLERCLSLLSKQNPDQKAFLELLDLRLLVETEMAGRLAEFPTIGSVRALRAALAMMVKATFDDPEPFARADTAFHLAIVEGVGHGLFATILKPLAPLAHQYGLETYDSKSTLDGVIREHRAVLRHIEAGNPEGARNAMADHLTSSRRHYAELLARRAVSNGAVVPMGTARPVASRRGR